MLLKSSLVAIVIASSLTLTGCAPFFTTEATCKVTEIQTAYDTDGNKIGTTIIEKTSKC